MTEAGWRSPVLLIVDLQRAIDDPKWRIHGDRNNPEAERNVARLLDAWRERNLPIFHVRHDSCEPGSPYRTDQPGNEFKSEATPRAGEAIVAKQTNSALIGTDLEQRLRGAGCNELLVCGVITNNSVEATVRVAGDLGFDTYLIEDACFTFPFPDRQGRLCSAEVVHAMSVANLEREYCTVLNTGEAVRRLVSNR